MVGKISGLLVMMFWLSTAGPVSAQSNITVNFFLLEDCVICCSYSQKINALHDRFGNDFKFVGFFPNFSSKYSTIDSFRNKYHIEFPLRTDHYKTYARKFDVSVTPEVVVFDEARQVILYKGRIDDEFIQIGRRKRVVQHHDLAEALEHLKVDPDKVRPFTKAIGCFINFEELK